MLRSDCSFLISEPTIFGSTSFPTDPTDINFRAIQFGVAFSILAVSTIVNLLPHRYLGMTVKATGLLMVILYLINMIWLPVAVSTTYGFNNASSVFSGITNNNGASTSYNWFINILFPMYSLVGFDASGHVAEETKKSHIASANGVFRSALWSSVFAFPLVLMFLFCYPQGSDFSTLAQPIVGMVLDSSDSLVRAFDGNKRSGVCSGTFSFIIPPEHSDNGAGYISTCVCHCKRWNLSKAARVRE